MGVLTFIMNSTNKNNVCILINNEELISEELYIPNLNENTALNDLLLDGVELNKSIVLNEIQAIQAIQLLIKFLNNSENNERMFSQSSDLQLLRIITCRCLNLNSPDGSILLKPSSDRQMVLARQIIMVVLARAKYGSLREIGEIFNLDHATVYHAKRVIQNYIDTRDAKHYTPIKQVLTFYNLLYKNE